MLAGAGGTGSAAGNGLDVAALVIGGGDTGLLFTGGDGRGRGARLGATGAGDSSRTDISCT